ncbi:MAG: sulfur carrier protein ThiS [Desulfuromusa sp.]|nr:sulfur carrier protein ThiS [Desulfuromusa sp.]
MKLTINGKIKEFPEKLTVQHLLQQLNLTPERVVVELNQKILSPDMHSNAKLKAEDTLELVQFVGGG